MKTIIVIIMVLFSTIVYAEDKKTWTATDTGLELVYTTFHVMDWSQTLHIARNPQQMSEANKILGVHPSTGRVNSYFALTLLGHVTLSYLLPKPYRNIWQGIWIGIEYDTVQHNREYGLGISLHF